VTSRAPLPRQLVSILSFHRSPLGKRPRFRCQLPRMIYGSRAGFLKVLMDDDIAIEKRAEVSLKAGEGALFRSAENAVVTRLSHWRKSD
jgi:hypothetical protein